MFSTPTHTGSDCDAGKYAANASTEDCTACDDLDGLTAPSGASVCVCVVGKYRDASGECVRCVDGMDCDEIGSSVTTITLTPGHWRANEATSEVIACPVEAACLGGSNTTGSCAAGNFGILCAICQGGYYRPGAYSVCKECGSQEDAVFTAIAIVVAMVIAILIFIQINRRAPNGLLRPFIDLVQKVSVMLVSV